MERTKQEYPNEYTDRIYAKFDQMTAKPLAGLFSEVGFNKTGLIKNWLKDRGHEYTWIDAPAYASDGARLSGKIRKQIGLFNPTGPDRHLYLIIAGYTTTDPSSILHSELCSLVESNPENLHIILIDRMPPPLPLTRLKAHNLYAQIESEALAYTQAEMCAFLDHACGISLKDYEAEAFYEVTSGWPAICRLISEHINEHPDTNLSLLAARSVSTVPDIYDYLENEIFLRESKETQYFLTKSSLLATLDETILDAMFEGTDGNNLNEICHERYYTKMDSNGRLQYLSPLRSFLYHRYCLTSPEEVSDLHTMLAELYAHRRAFTDAFGHAVAGGDYFLAQRIFQKIRDRYDPIQFVDMIDGHLESLASDLHFAQTSLFLTRCIPDSTLIEFIPFLEEIIRFETSRANTYQLANLCNRLGVIRFATGYIKLAEDCLCNSNRYAQVLGDHQLMVCNSQLLADCYRMQGDMDKAMDTAKNALYIADRYHYHTMQFHTLEVLHRLCLAKGDIRRAKNYLEEASELSGEDPFLDLWLFQDRSGLLLREGHPEEAVPMARKACSCTPSDAIGYDVASTRLTLGEALMGAGEYDEAMACLDIAYENATNCGFLLHDILVLQIKLLAEQKQDDKVAAKRRELQTVCSDYGYSWSPYFEVPASDSAMTPSPEQREDIIEIRTMGRFEVLRKGHPVSINRSSSISLLQFLLCQKGVGTNKEVIIDTLFPQDQDTNHFNVALSVLRKSLEPGLTSGKDSRFILRQKHSYLVNMDAFRMDAYELMDVCEAITSSEEKLDVSLIAKFNELYRGEFMADYPYEEFLERERSRIGQTCMETLVFIADYYRNSSTPARGIEYYERILAADPYNDQMYIDYIDVLLSLRATHKARDIAGKMIQTIEEELGTPVRSLLEKLFAEHGFTYN